MALPILSTAQAFTEQQIRNAKVGEMAADTQATLTKILLGQQEFQLRQKQEQMNDAYLQQLQQRALQAQSQSNVPNTPSLGQAQDTALAPGGLNARMMSDLSAEKARLESDVQFARVNLRPPAEYSPLLTRLNAIDGDLRQATAKQEEYRMQNAEQIANTLRDAKTPEDIRNAITNIGSTFGFAAAANVDKALLHDPTTGEYLMNPQQVARIAPIVNRFVDMKLASQNKHNAALEAQRAAELEQTKVRDATTRDNVNSEIAWRQGSLAERWAALNQRKSQFEQTMELTGLKQEQKVTKDDQAQIYKLANEYKIKDYQQGYNVAARTAEALQDPAKGYEAVTPANARALVDQAKLMFNNYRSQGGTSKYVEQNYRQMNSILNNPEKWIDTIGTGNKVLAKDRMLELSNEMARFYQERNADLVKRELAIVQNTNRKGGNASYLTLTGNVGDAVTSGQAKQVSYQGKDYVVFGPRPEDKFELPSAPERRYGVMLPTGE